MKPPEEVAREIMKQYARSGCLIDVGSLEAAITAALTAERQRLKDAEKLVAQCLETLTDGEQSEPHGYIPTINACRKFLDDFRKEK